jgi:glycosyltransferase involved in cell wall biosynthesis
MNNPREPMEPAATRDAVHIAPVLPLDVRSLARALEETGRLRWLVTGYAYRRHGRLERCCTLADAALGGRLVPLLRRRTLEGIPPERLRRCLGPQARAYLWRKLLGAKAETPGGEDALLQALDRFAARRVIDETTALVLGREDGCLESFRKARAVGATTVYDLPIAHHRTLRRILEQEEEVFPGVCRYPRIAGAHAPHRVEHKEAELRAADHVVVLSGFVRNSLVDAGYPAERITVLPPPCVESWLAEAPRPAAARGNVVLHVGRLCLRKGTHRLLRAWKRLGAYRTHTLRLVGDLFLTPSFLADFQGCYEYSGWLPREELRECYARAALFVLPSFAEGFANVLMEALSSGLPILASRNSGAEGFLEHGRECLLHEAGNEDELCAHVDSLLSQPRRREAMADEARQRARNAGGAHARAFAELLGRSVLAPAACGSV